MPTGHPHGASEWRAASEYGVWKGNKGQRTKVWGPSSTGDIWDRRRSPRARIYPVLWRATFKGLEEKKELAKLIEKHQLVRWDDSMVV